MNGILKIAYIYLFLFTGLFTGCSLVALSEETKPDIKKIKRLGAGLFLLELLITCWLFFTDGFNAGILIGTIISGVGIGVSLLSFHTKTEQCENSDEGESKKE